MSATTKPSDVREKEKEEAKVESLAEYVELYWVSRKRFSFGYEGFPAAVK